MEVFVDNLLKRLDRMEKAIFNEQYSRRATTNVIERCDAQLRLIEKIRKEIKLAIEEVNK